MLGPGTDSLSFYLESRASINCPVEAIRWCWQSYLELDGCDHTLLTNAKSRKDALTRNTSRNSWEQCKWKNTNARRLIEPFVDLPNELDREDSPKIFIVTTAADPVRDDGVQLVNTLKQAGASVTHIECQGSHVIGYVVDFPARSKALVGWSATVFA